MNSGTISTEQQREADGVYISVLHKGRADSLLIWAAAHATRLEREYDSAHSRGNRERCYPYYPTRLSN